MNVLCIWNKICNVMSLKTTTESPIKKKSIKLRVMSLETNAYYLTLVI